MQTLLQLLVPRRFLCGSCRCVDLVHFTSAGIGKGLLDRLLRGEIRSSKSLSIWTDTWKYIIQLPYDKKLINFSILLMNGKIGETSKPKRLEVSIKARNNGRNFFGACEETTSFTWICPTPNSMRRRSGPDGSYCR